MKTLRGPLDLLLVGALAVGCTAGALHVGAGASEATGAAERTEASEPAPATESSCAEQARVLSFADLALPDETADFLLDALFEGVAVTEGEFELPEAVRALEGQTVTIEGYMIASKWTGTRLREFLLVRDQSSCCVGSVPRPGHWVQVHVTDDEGQEFLPYVPVRVLGVFGLNRTLPEGGFVTSTYTLECESVERSTQ